jgi:uncharacterized protein (TIGR02231 family)
MRILSLTVGLLCLAALGLRAQDERNIASQVKEVTVFLNRAQVLNTAQVALAAGTSTLVFEELSTKLLQQSIQVSAKGNLTIMSVKHRINYMRSQQKAQKLKNLERELEGYQDQLSRLQMQKRILQEEEKMILENKKIGGENNGVSAQHLREIADFYRIRLNDVNVKILDLDKEIKKASESVQKTQQQIKEENTQANKPTSEIIVVVKADAPTNAQFELAYIVPDAGWQPTYDLRAKDSKSPVQLSYRANVYQNTGVDWKNVKITLSTGNPAVGGNKPELSPWYVDIYEAAKYKKQSYASGNKRAEAAKSAPSVNYDEVERSLGDIPMEPESKTLDEFTEVAENTLATEFEITLPYTVLSDGKPQLVDIKKYDVSTLYAHSTVPKLDKDAFLMAQLVDWEKYNLLSGTANVYFEGSYIGESYLNAQNTKDTLALSLGRDKRVVIEREKIKDFTSKKVLGSNIREEFGYEIAIRNTKRERITITIEEQIPVSKNSKVEVELLEATGARFDAVTGKLVWKINVEPQSTQKLVLRYSMKYPKNLQVYY